MDDSHGLHIGSAGELADNLVPILHGLSRSCNSNGKLLSRRIKQERQLTLKLSQLQHKVSASRQKLVSLRILEDTFQHGVEDYLCRIAPRDKSFFTFMFYLVPTSFPYAESELCWTSMIERIPRDNASRELWVDSHLDTITSNLRLLDKRHEEISTLFERLRFYDRELDLEEELREHKRREEELFMQHLERLYRYYAALLEKLLESLLACCDVTVLPNRHRPPCRTMPWDILPSLVILWGVCWMFYNPPVTPRLDESDTLFNPIHLNGSLNMPTYHRESNLAQGNSVWNGQEWTWTDPAFDMITDLLHQSHSGHESDSPGDYVEEAQSESRMPHLPPPWYSKDKLPQRMSPEKETDYDVSTYFDHRNISYMSFEPALNDPLADTTGDDDQHQTTLPASGSGPSSTRSPLHTSTEATSWELARQHGSTRPQGDTGNSLRCDREVCEEVTFRIRSDWERHMNRHSRPFICNVVGCTRVDGFSSKGILQRHMKMHSRASAAETAALAGNTSFYCPEPTCDRSFSHSSNKPFTRKDNRDDHVRRKHGSNATRQSSAMCGEALFVFEGESFTSDELAPEERRSPTRNAQERVPASGKRKHVETTETCTCPSHPTVADCSHRTEIDDLKEEIKKLRRELEASKEKEEALFAALIQSTKYRSKDA